MTTNPAILALARLLARQAATAQYLGNPGQVQAGVNDNAATSKEAPDARRDLRPLQQRPAIR